MKQTDYLQRILFEDIHARCVWVRLESVVHQVLEGNEYPPAVAELLAQGLLVVAVLSSGIKFSGRISLQLQSSSGPLSLLMADCTEDGGVRGVAQLAEDARVPDRSEQLFAELLSDGILTLTLDPPDGGQRWQGIVPLEGTSLAEAIEAYFGRSEQLPTRLRLAVEGTGQREGACALMIQQMPGDVEDEDEDGWNRLLHLFATVGQQEMLELAGDDLLQRLFHEENRRLLPARGLRFYCPCSRERVMGVLQGLGAAELTELAEEEKAVEVRCQFCNRLYRFDRLDIASIVQGGDEGGPTVH